MAAEPVPTSRPAASLVPSDGYSLRLAQQDTSTVTLALKRTATLVGRDARCFVRLRSSTVSGLHALLVIDGARLYVRDLASRTGVLVNGQHVVESVLAHGDRLTIGRFAFDVIGPLASTAPAAKRARSASFKVDDRVIPATRRCFLICGSGGRHTHADALAADTAGPLAVIFETGGRRFALNLGDPADVRLGGVPLELARIRAGMTVDLGASTCTYLPPLEEPGPTPAGAAPGAAPSTVGLEPSLPPRPSLSDSFWNLTEDAGSIAGELGVVTEPAVPSPPTDFDWPSWDVLPPEVATTLDQSCDAVVQPICEKSVTTDLANEANNSIPAETPISADIASSHNPTRKDLAPLSEASEVPRARFTPARVVTPSRARSRRRLRVAAQCLALMLGLGTIAFIHRGGPAWVSASGWRGERSTSESAELQALANLAVQKAEIESQRRVIGVLLRSAPTPEQISQAEQDLAESKSLLDAVTAELFAAERVAAAVPVHQDLRALLDDQVATRDELARLSAAKQAAPSGEQEPDDTDAAERALAAASARLAGLVAEPTTRPADASLRSFAATAQTILTSTRTLTDRLLQRQQQQLETLQQFSKRLEERAEARRQRVAGQDEQYAQLRNQLESVRRKLEAATASGLSAEVAELSGEASYLDELMTARLALLSVDPEDQRTAAQIVELANQLATALTEDQEQADHLLESTKAALTQLATTMQQAPSDQADTLEQIRSAVSDLQAAGAVATAQHRDAIRRRHEAVLAAHQRLAEIDRRLAEIAATAPTITAPPPEKMAELRAAEALARNAHMAAANKLAELRRRDEQALQARQQLQQLEGQLAALSAGK